jgi:endoglucanase
MSRLQRPNERTFLIPRQGREQPRKKLKSRRNIKWIPIAFATCAIGVFYLYLSLGRSRGLVDPQELVPPHGVQLNSSISTIPEFRPPFRTQGRQILDVVNSSVRLTAVNWYGASDIYFVPSGLDIRHRDEISILIRRMGFNSVRLPYSDEMVLSNPLIPATHLTANPDLVGHRALDVYNAIVESLTAAGLLVVINNHITQATWCCGANPCDAGWSNDWLGPLCRVRQTESGWIENWETVMRPLVENPLVIGIDLRNEVRGLWGTMRWKSWVAAAEKAAETLLRMNQNWLIIVEGTSSGNDLSGVRERPVQLSIPERVVYSAHVYSWSGWGALAPYSQTSYESFAAAMRKNWAYLMEEDIAPVWVGEFGTPDWPSKGDLNYWKHLVQFLDEIEAQWGYWAINPRKPASNEMESYGLVKDDWKTMKWDYRMQNLLDIGLNLSQVNNTTG